MITEIKLGNYITLYKTNLDDIDNSKLINELTLACQIAKDVSHPNSNTRNPGIQYFQCLNSILINKVRNKIVDFMFNIVDNPHYYHTHEWVFISQNTNTLTGYHTHTNESTHRIINQLPDYTITYYVQMPDNLEGNDGHLSFKDIDDNEFSILPKEGDLIIFKADLQHKAETNLKSEKDRIVFCTNFTFLDLNKKYIKNQNTII
jgi:hypothetical protein